MHWIMYSLISTAGFTGVVLIFKQITKSWLKSEIINFYFFLFMTVTFLLFSVFKKSSFKMDSHLLYWFLALSFVSFIANYFNIISIGLAPNPGYVKAIQSLQIVFIGVLSYLLLGSSLNSKAFAWIALILWGLYLVVSYG